MNAFENQFHELDKPSVERRLINEPSPVSSGSLLLGPYKMPLKKLEDGFGYDGTITLDVEGKIQCHICGYLFDNLAQHVFYHHGLRSREYKSKFNLSPSTALISERRREEFKANGLRVWLRKSPEEKEAARANRELNKYKKKNPNTFTGLSLEKKNLRGTCPDQLLSLIKNAAEHYGHTPSISDFEVFHGTQRFMNPIIKTFGSWKKAIEKCGLEVRKSGPQYSADRPWRMYDDEELLDLLSIYASTNKVTPMASDFRRGFLPSFATYIKRFGSLIQARRLAGIEEYHDGRFKGINEKPLWKIQRDKKILELSGSADADIIKSAM